jgi:hypothetical protein
MPARHVEVRDDGRDRPLILAARATAELGNIRPAEPAPS